MIKKQGFFSSLPPCGGSGASSIRNEVRVSFFFGLTLIDLLDLFYIMDLVDLMNLTDIFLDEFLDNFLGALDFYKLF